MSDDRHLLAQAQTLRTNLLVAAKARDAARDAIRAFLRSNHLPDECILPEESLDRWLLERWLLPQLEAPGNNPPALPLDMPKQVA